MAPNHLLQGVRFSRGVPNIVSSGGSGSVTTNHGKQVRLLYGAPVNMFMFEQLLYQYINDLKIESVKLQLQVGAPSDEKQTNPIVGRIFIEEINGPHLMATLTHELKGLNDIHTIEQLKETYNRWNQNKIHIQYNDYGFGDDRTKRISEVYCYLFLIRMLKQHKELFSVVK